MVFSAFQLQTFPATLRKLAYGHGLTENMMGRSLLWLAASIPPLMLAACTAQQVPTSNEENNALCRMLPGKSEAIRSSKSGIQYLPPSFGKVMHICKFKGYPECFPKISNFESEWYSNHWEAATEPSLFEISNAQKYAGDSVLRFTWLPTFHHPVIVRFETSAGTTNFIAKELSGAGGYEPGSISRQINRKLSSLEEHQVERAMARASPFNEPPENCGGGTDGSRWILERARKGSYEYADRWSPQKGAMRDFGLLTLKLTGWEFEEIY